MEDQTEDQQPQPTTISIGDSKCGNIHPHLMQWLNQAIITEWAPIPMLMDVKFWAKTRRSWWRQPQISNQRPSQQCHESPKNDKGHCQKGGRKRQRSTGHCIIHKCPTCETDQTRIKHLIRKNAESRSSNRNKHNRTDPYLERYPSRRSSPLRRRTPSPRRHSPYRRSMDRHESTHQQGDKTEADPTAPTGSLEDANTDIGPMKTQN